MTKLNRPLHRELQVGDDACTLTIDPEGLKLALKGHRNGTELRCRRRQPEHAPFPASTSTP